MKYNRFFRILTVAIILSLLMLAIPVTPALAAPTVTLSPEVGKIGDRVNIEGKGFPQNQGLSIYFSSQQAATTKKIDVDVTAYKRLGRVVTYGLEYGADAGKFGTTGTTFFNVPSELNDGDDKEFVHGGTYYIYTADENTDIILTVNKFTVIGIKQLTPPEGSVGTRVTIEGVAFEDKEGISIKYDGVDVPIAGGAIKTGSAGDFTCKIDIPASTAGVHTITAIVKEVEGPARFTVVPAITVNPTSGGANDQVTVSGTGFGDEVALTITFDGEAMNISGDDETDEYGSFVSTFIVPSEVEVGTYEIRVEDDDGNTAEAEFTIASSLTLSSGATAASPGHVGMDLTITGTNFRANYPITITYDNEPVPLPPISFADGSFSYTFTVPPSVVAVHIITATDGANTAETRFFMESTPPPTPSPLLPLMGDKLKGKFDWGGDADNPSVEVTDDSLPITYDLQVASDENFTTLLLDKTGLTTSEYTLTGDDKLESTQKEAPYYWRVRAVDAASNAGDWTSAGTFYVGFTFSGIHGWLLYLLIAIGVLLALFFGIWIGRKLTSREEDYWG